MLLTSFLNKPIINLFDSKKEGLIKSVDLNFKQKKVNGFIIENENKLFFIEAKDIFSATESCCVIKYDVKIPYKKELPDLKIDLKAYDVLGNFLGNVKDYEIEKNKILKILIDNDIFDISYLLKVNEIFVMKNDTISLSLKEKTPQKSPKKKTKLNDEITDDNTHISYDDLNESTITNDSDYQKNLPFSFLFGKTVSKTINWNNVEIKKGTVLTSEIIETAKKSGMLFKIIYDVFNGNAYRF